MWNEGRFFSLCTYLLIAPQECKKTKNCLLKLCLKTKQTAPHRVFPVAPPRSRGGQRPGGHFSADANSVQREVRSREKPEAAAPRAARDLHLRLGWGLSVSEPGGAACRRRLQGGGRRGDAAWSGPKTGNPRHIRLLCMFTSFLCRFLPSVLQHLTFYFCIGNNGLNSRSRGDPVVAGGGRGRASERAGSDTQVHLRKTVLGAVSTCKKTQKM